MVWSPLPDFYWTPLLHAPVLLLHEHSITLDIVFYINTYYTRYCYFMYKYHITQILVHRTLLLHIHEPLIHGYTITLDTVTQILCTLFCMFLSLLHDSPVCMHWLSLYFLLRGSLVISHELLLHGYSCILIAWLFPVTTILIFPLLDMWAVDMRCVKLSATWIQATWATFRIPHLLFSVSCYLISCYQQSSCSVILLHVLCTVLVPDTLCTLNVLNITWVGETWRLTRSCRVDIWIHYLSHCWGRDSAGYRLL